MCVCKLGCVFSSLVMHKSVFIHTRVPLADCVLVRFEDVN